jgi:hypothetical protein
MDLTTYTDGASSLRTIKAVVYTESCSGSGDDDIFYFSLDGTGLADTDVTWLDITWDNTAGTPTTVDRSVDATLYTSSLNGSTHWRDSPAAGNWGDVDADTDFVLTTS